MIRLTQQKHYIRHDHSQQDPNRGPTVKQQLTLPYTSRVSPTVPDEPL
jgi:hypothetical protein